MFARMPRAALVSRMFSPAAFACGPAIFNASKRSVSVCAEPFAVVVSTSATSDILPASMPKMRMEFAAMSAASPSSVPVARARSSVGWIASSISFGEKPMRPSETMPSATSFAVNEVSRPSFSATFVIDSNSEAVALVTAFARRIRSSNPAKPFTARTNGSAIAPESISRSLPMESQERPKFLSCSCATLRLRWSLLVSAVTST